MSFLDKIKSVLGFGPDIDLEDESPQDERPALAAPSDSEPLELSQQAATEIFAKVVEIFNAAQPQFIAKSLDPERQKRILYEALDESLRCYLAGLKQAARDESQALFSQERAQLLAEAENLKKRAADLEGKRAEVHDRQISAERQKRALAERVHDLEAQVIALEAEKEQYEIENKCMINKAKAATVLENEIEELRAQLASHNNGVPAQADPALKAELEKAKEENEQLNSKIAEMTERAKELEEQALALMEENEKLATARDQSKVKDEMSDAMFNDFQKMAAEANRNAKALQEQVDALQSELAQKDARIDDLNRLVQEKEAMIEEDEAARKEIEEIQQQIELFENVKTKMDARIEKLRASLQASQKENESLRLTIKNNLREHAQEQKRLQDEINALKQPSASADEPLADTAAEPVDEYLTGADWLVSTPPKQQQSMRQKADDVEFGYQPPQRKPRMPENDAQMSLFD